MVIGPQIQTEISYVSGAFDDDSIEPITVDETGLNKGYNIFLRTFGMLIYILLLIAVIFNIIIFVIGKQRYRDFFIVMYYVFFLGLVISRICQTAFGFSHIYS